MVRRPASHALASNPLVPCASFCSIPKLLLRPWVVVRQRDAVSMREARLNKMMLAFKASRAEQPERSPASLSL